MSDARTWGHSPLTHVTLPPTTPVSVTETFSGKLTPADSKLHSFKVGAGVVTTILSTVGPDSTLVLGFGVGTWDGTSCTVVMQNDNAVQGSYLIGTATATIEMCVKAYDVGNIVEEATYEFSVVHY